MLRVNLWNSLIEEVIVKFCEKSFFLHSGEWLTGTITGDDHKKGFDQNFKIQP